MPEAKEKRLLGRDEPGVFDHNVETLGSFKAYGGGLNRFSGPATFEKWLEIPHRDADPTAWGTNERGRTFFHTTANLFKFWDGTQFLGLAAGPVAGFSEGAIPFGGSGGGFLDEDSTKIFFTNATDTFNVVGIIALTGSLNVTGDSSLDGAVVINNSNADKDFRVEGSGATYTHLLFVDASANMVGINEDAPKALLHARHGTCADYAGVYPNTALLLEGTSNIALQLQAATDGTAYIIFADDDYNPSAGAIIYTFTDNTINFNTGGNSRVDISGTGLICYAPLLAVDIAGQGVPGIIQIDTNEADAYYELREDADLKWAWGYDYNDSFKFKLGEGLPGTNTVFEIAASSGALAFVRSADKGLQYLDTGSDLRWMLRVASATNVVELLNRASHGKVEIHANTITAGDAGDTLVATFEDDIISLTTELDISSASTTLLDLNPGGSVTQCIIDITPTTALVEGRTWDGICITADALDPATGDACTIHGFHFTALNLASIDHDAEVVGFITRAGAADDFTGFQATITEATQDIAQNAFLAFGGSVVLSATAKYRGLYVDYDSLSRNAGAPILEGVRIKLPANYASFGTSFAGYFEGDGRSVTLCDTTYALTTSGAMNLVGTIIGVTELTVSTFIRLSSNGELRFYDNGNYVGFEAPALSDDQIWVLPAADGGASEFLQTDGGGNLDWAAPSAPADAASKTTAAWDKSIGSGGDYPDWADMIAAMPDLIAHDSTITIEVGTTLSEICELRNKHGLTADALITIEAEKYYPTASAVPTADSATATTLRDAELATAALGNDYFNGCWVFIVDGTGTDNGYVLITDYVDATGDVVVASWPGTRPDNTSRYIIVGALIDGGGVRRYGLDVQSNTCRIYFRGIGWNDIAFNAIFASYNLSIRFEYCGLYDVGYTGIECNTAINCFFIRGGIVKCNTNNTATHGGARASNTAAFSFAYTGFSDNGRRGVLLMSGAFGIMTGNFGDGNGAWGTEAQSSAQIKITGIECSGAAGNHVDPGTAGDDSADQAVVY